MIAIVLLNAGAFAYEAMQPAGGSREALIGAYAMVPYDVTHGLAEGAGPGPPATLVTSLFLHASIPHIAFNLLFLAAFGPAIEYAIGPFRFIALYIACGILGSLAQISIDPGSHVPEIGASGAIAGVLGAYILRFPHAPSFLGLPAFLVIGLWAALQFVHGFGSLSTSVLSERPGGTAYFAHIGGFLAGVFASALFVPRATSPHDAGYGAYHR